MQEEERRENVEKRQHSMDLALTAKCKQTFKGKPWIRNRGRPESKSPQGASSSETLDNFVQKEGNCSYCGKPGHYAK